MPFTTRNGFFFLAISIAFFPILASAATGTIVNASPASTSAWSDQSGWVNWKATNGNVAVTDSALTGYIWASNHGWINLAPTNGGVLHNGTGVLSGYAWGQNAGWINFSGVTIDGTTGIFHGHTVAQSVFGTMNFDCTHCLVQTSWRKTTTNPGGNGSPVIYGGGGGGGGPIQPQQTATTTTTSPTRPITPAFPAYAEPDYYAEGSYTPSAPRQVKRPAATEPTAPPAPTPAPATSFNISGAQSFAAGTAPSFVIIATSQTRASGAATIVYSVTNPSGKTIYTASATAPDIARGIALSLPLTSVPPGTYILSAEVTYGDEPVQILSRAFAIEAASQTGTNPVQTPITAPCFWDPLLAFLPSFLGYCWLPPWIILIITLLTLFALYRRYQKNRGDRGYPPHIT